jgi:hypothetical protein
MRRNPRVLIGILVKKRDAHLDEDKHSKARDEHKDRLDRNEEQRKKLIKMGFSEEAVNASSATGDEPVEILDEDDPQRRAQVIKKRRLQGLVSSHIEQSSRHFHGVPPDATDKKQGKKRKGGAAPDPARYVPPPDN